MPSGTTTKDGLFVPEILADAVEGGFVGLQALWGTGAAVVNTNMPYGNDDLGNEVKIPYFDLIGDLEDLSPDGGELSPAQLTSSVELATVIHSGKSIEFTKWARLNPTDPYGEGARQITVAVQRRGDKALIDAAKDTTGWSAYTVDIFNAVTPKLMDYDLITNGMATLGDEGMGEMPAVLVVHSKVAKDMRLDKDADGNPRLVKTMAGMLPVIDTLGIPLAVSDRIPPALTSGVNKYQSLLCYPGSLVFWINGQPEFWETINGRKPSNETNVHIYHASHRYKRRRGGKSKPGVVHLFHN